MDMQAAADFAVFVRRPEARCSGEKNVTHSDDYAIINAAAAASLVSRFVSVKASLHRATVEPPKRRWDPFLQWEFSLRLEFHFFTVVRRCYLFSVEKRSLLLRS